MATRNGSSVRRRILGRRLRLLREEAAVGAHLALASGFSVLSFGDLGEPDMAYVEHALGAVHRERRTTSRALGSLSTSCGPSRWPRRSPRR